MRPRRRAAVAALISLLTLPSLLPLLSPAPAAALLELRFVAPPTLPPLPSLSLNARAQSDSAAMTPFSIEDLRLTKSGWNLTVQGQSGAGRSPVFAQYCPKAKCGSDAEGYVAGGAALAAGSLTLNSTGASFSGGLGVAPTLQCASGCPVDAATPVKIASDATGLLAGEGVWSAGGFAANSLSLAAPTTLRAPPNEENYRLNVLWTLSTGP
ncbi:MAG TPA: hypothetical protein VHW67_07650 [Solirubrobacteraceae bacterium]|jgi:hypothetical protein|nr:hypothetical protein [Solirubrobacteraceae bacterium]